MMPALLRCLVLALALTTAAAACDKTPPAATPDSSTNVAPSDGPKESAATDSSREGAADACTSDNCVVPLADLGGVCGPTLHAATNDCPGTTVFVGPCGTLTHVAIHTVDPIEDCYYDTASGALVGGIVRSDAGFTMIAGTIPTDTCAATTQVCDHTFLITSGADAASDGDGPAGDAAADGRGATTDGGACPASFLAYPSRLFCSMLNATCDYAEGRCACSACEVTPEEFLYVWSCRTWGAGGIGCPPRSPAVGSACDRPNLNCDYSAGCGISVGDDVTCVSGVWQKQTPPTSTCATPMCP